MITNKQIVKVLVVINTIYVVYSLFLLLLPNMSFSRNSVWVIVPTILSFIVFWGLLWVLFIFKEHWWIKLVLIAYLIMQILGLLIIYFFQDKPITTMLFHFLINGKYYLTILLAITLLFVRDKVIRKYLWGLSPLLFFAFLTLRPIGFSYDEFTMRWMLIIKELITQLPFIILLALNIKLYRFLNTVDLVIKEPII